MFSPTPDLLEKWTPKVILHDDCTKTNTVVNREDVGESNSTNGPHLHI